MSRQGGIVIVGPCAAGKSTLAKQLNEAGWSARQIAQEHSYVPDMWQQLSRPQTLVFLDASFETCTARKSLDWTRREYETQQVRLAHARRHSDLVVETDQLTPEGVFRKVRQWLVGGQAERRAV